MSNIVTNNSNNSNEELTLLSMIANHDMINDIDAALKEELAKKEFEIKKKQVELVHPYPIRERTRKKNGDDNYVYYTTTCPWLKSEPRTHTERELINKLYAYYYGDSDNKFSFKNVFEKALDEKIKTERIKEKTIRDIRTSYKAFITDEFGAQDIHNIKPSQVKEYIQTITKEKILTKKRFYKFKGILNLTFEYALDPERRYIDVNPVPNNNRAFTKNLTQTSNNPENKAFHPFEVEQIRKYLWQRIEESTYDIYGYAILFSSHTGVRLGEIPALKWSDIGYNSIHIHAQQNDERRDGHRVYYYNPTTKNEKGVSNNGRYIPLTNNIREILESLRQRQTDLGIQSEWVFCNKHGDWITTKSYYDALCRVSQKLGLRLSNNHAFRMYLNSYIYIPMGLPVTERAKLLGHTVETNLKNYTFARTDDHLNELINQINSFEGSDLLPNDKNNILRFNPEKSRKTHYI